MRVFLIHTLNSEHKSFLTNQDAISALENEWPRPSINTIKTAAEVFCSLPWEYLRDHLDGLHPVTPQHKLPHRCFDVYLLVSLLTAYGFDASATDVTFALNINKIDIEWTIGSFLEERLFLTREEGVAYEVEELEDDDLAEELFLLVSCSFFFCCLYLYLGKSMRNAPIRGFNSAL
mmetsp:Transcript_10096/g.11616  ORF Transcript_10096/g.11616 Transcript_10096/m.11616 type:complete len:176 (+) Transcript_10096:2-529(+)